MVGELFALEEVTAEAHMMKRKELLKKLASTEGMSYLNAKREIDVSYPGVPLSLPVTSISDEVDVRWACVLRSEALRMEVLPGLSCELELIQYTSAVEKNFTIEAVLLADNKSTREKANTQHESLGNLRGQ